VMIRDCFSWVDSLLEHWARVAARVAASRSASFVRTGMDDVPEVVRSWVTVEGQLRAGRATAGLAVAMLRTWATSYTRLLAAAPDDRTLVLRTEDLDASGPQLAALCAVDPSTLRPGLHWNAAPSRLGVLAAVAPALLVSEAERWCAPLMEQHWGPQWRELVTRIPDGVGTL
jgi:hypothetical protein